LRGRSLLLFATVAPAGLLLLLLFVFIIIGKGIIHGRIGE